MSVEKWGLLVSIVLAAAAIAGNAWVAKMNGDAQREVERSREQSEVILQSINTNGDEKRAKKNLQFVVDAGLVTGEQRNRLAEFLTSAKLEDIPTLGFNPCMPLWGVGGGAPAGAPDFPADISACQHARQR